MIGRCGAARRLTWRRAKATLVVEQTNSSLRSQGHGLCRAETRAKASLAVSTTESAMDLGTFQVPQVRQPRLIGVGATTWAHGRCKLAQAPLPNGLYSLERPDYFRHDQLLLDEDEEAAYRNGALSLRSGGPADTEQWRAVRHECLAMSRGCGLLDFSSLSRFVVEGPGATAMLQHMFTNSVAGSEVPLGSLKYTMRTDAEGRVAGSLMVLKMTEEKYLLMCYALTSRLDWLNLQENLPSGVALRDVTWDFALFMVTGPQTDVVMQSLMPDESWERVAALPNFMAAPVMIGGVLATVSRVSYCGGLGYEVHVPIHDGAASSLYEQLRCCSLAPVTEMGYTALQVMRTEAARPCFTVDIPMGARYVDCVPRFLAKLGDTQPDFLGKAAIKSGDPAGKFVVHLAAEDPKFFTSCMNVEAPAVGGKHRLLFNGQDVGHVSSAFYGFRAGRAVLLALLDKRPDLGLTGKKALTQAEPGQLCVTDESGAAATAVTVVRDAEALIAC